MEITDDRQEIIYNRMLFVSQDIKQETIDCKKGFSCLSAERKDLCRVLSCFDCDIHFILCLNTEFCSYQHKISERFYCDCPTRKELYSKYNV